MRMFRGFLLIGLLGALPTLGWADSRELPVIRNTQLGYNHQFHNHYWTPLRVDLENPGPERQAVLVIEPVSHAAGQTVTLAKPIWLPANSRRTVFLTVLPEHNETALPVNRNGTAPPAIPKVLSAKLTDGGLQVWSQSDILGKVIPEEAAVMLVGDVRLNSYRIPAEIPVSFGKRPVERVGLAPANLPARAIDYDGINLLVLGDPGVINLNTMQRQAIVDWVRAGGTLLFTPGPGDTNGWFESWSALLPGIYQPGDRLATEPRLSQWGTPPVFSDGLRLRRLLVQGGEVLAGSPASPLLVARPEGLGHVAAFVLDASDLNFQRWVGVTNFNAEVISRALHTIPAADRLLEKSSVADAILSSLAGIKVLGRGAVLSYLAGLVVVLLLVVAAFRFTATPENGWPVVAGLAVVVGGLAIVIAQRWKGQPQPFLNEVAVVLVGAESQSALAQAALGLYSPRAAKFDLDTTGETIRLRPPASGSLSTDPFSLQFDDHLRLPGLAVRASDMRAMYGEAALPAGPYPQARARLTPAGLELRVTNPTHQRLADCFFKSNRLVVPLGDFAAGETRTLPNLAAGITQQFSTRVVASTEDELRARIRRVFFPDPIYSLDRLRTSALLSRHARNALGDWAPAVYGWTDQPIFPLTGSGTLARRSVGMWAIETPVAYTGPRLTIPRGLMKLRLKNTDARTLERAEGRFSSTRGGKIVVEFSLPAECPNLRVETAAAIVDFHGSAFRCHVQLLPPGQSEISIQKSALSGGPVYPIAQPEDWYDPQRRSFTVAIEITSVNTELLQQMAVSYWQIRELDLELGGTVQ